jgi:hypothetical protein
MAVVKLRAFANTATLVCCFACGGGASGPTQIATSECSTLSQRDDWAVDPFQTIQSDLELEVGQSKTVSVGVNRAFDCPSAVADVIWSVDTPTVASIVAGRPLAGWVTGLTTGTASIGAQLIFSDGIRKVARPRTLRVLTPAGPAPGSRVVTEGVLDIDAPVTRPGRVSRFVVVVTTQSGRIDVSIDWVSPLASLDMSGYEGECAAVPCPGAIRMTIRDLGVKPLAGTFDGSPTPAGSYTVRIDNLGSATERVTYTVRLTPR